MSAVVLFVRLAEGVMLDDDLERGGCRAKIRNRRLARPRAG